MGIKIITDSICDVPDKFKNEYEIIVVPLTVHFGDKDYRDGIDITSEEFFRMLEKAEELPKTSQVSPIEFLKVFKEELEKGNELIVINGSSGLSGTFNSAILAKNELQSERSGLSDRIHILDSRAASLGAGILVIKAAKMAKEGSSINEIIPVIENSITNLKSYYVLDTLKYLYKGGRISLSSSVLGSILHIKPILTIEDGKIIFMNKSRSTKKAVSLLISLIRENEWSLDGKIIGINHSNSENIANMVEEMLRKEFNIKEVIRGDVGPVVATYAGPGAVAFYFEV